MFKAFIECFGEILEKSFGVKLGEVSLHGHIVSRKGIEVDKAKVELIQHLLTLKCVKDIRSFLGHAGFYHRFIEGFSSISRPLCHLLSLDVSFE